MKIRIYSDIINDVDTLFYEYYTGNKPVTARSIKDALDSSEDKEAELNIHCDGGSVSEAFAAYDILRTSGKNIKANIDGGCHSAAIILLLAAPAENRTANKNATALIHDVTGYVGCVNPTEAKKAAEYLESQRERILNLYAERTSRPIDELRNIMLEEKERTTNELLAWGFINSINPYTSNSKNMSKLDKVLNSIRDYFSGVKNYTHTATDGSTFETESEGAEIAVDMPASPDGTYPMTGEDGGEFTVTIAGGVVTEIVVPASADETPVEEVIAENTKLKAENKTLREEKAKLENILKETQTILEANNNIKSVAKMTPRANNQPPKRGGGGKAAVKDNLEHTGPKK